MLIFFSDSDWGYFYTREVSGNKTYGIEVGSPFCICWMFNFSVTGYKEIIEDTGHVSW